MAKVTFQNDDGTTDTVDIVDKTRPRAMVDVECAWSGDKPHTIKKGDRHVRIVYKLSDGNFKSDHICFDCYCGLKS